MEFHFANNFTSWPSFSYPDYTHAYCRAGYRVTGSQNIPIGVFYVAQYLIYLAIYLPSLIVIARPPLSRHACYKLMLSVGVADNVFGFFGTFMAGVFSLMGANYCDNPTLLKFFGHVVHSLWYAYCTSAVVSGLNRLIELRSPTVWTPRLYAGGRAWLRAAAPFIYSSIHQWGY